jgi:hypothetical protein
MPCVELDTKNGPVLAFVCGTSMKVCRFCRLRLAKKLCDFPISKRGKTCDAPMCDGCSAHIGADTDYCPEHKGQTPPQQKLFPGNEDKAAIA